MRGPSLICEISSGVYDMARAHRRRNHRTLREKDSLLSITLMEDVDKNVKREIPWQM